MLCWASVFVPDFVDSAEKRRSEAGQPSDPTLGGTTQQTEEVVFPQTVEIVCDSYALT